MKAAIALLLLSLGSVSRAEDWFVARTGANNIYAAVLGNSCGTYTGFVNTGTYPGAVAINPAGSRVYVANFASSPTPGGDSVTVIDTASASPIKTITGISSPQDVAATNGRLFVASGSRVLVIDTVSYATIATVTLPGTARRLTFNAALNRVYVTTPSSLISIDGATNAVIGSTTVDDATDVAVTPDGHRAYVTRATPGPVAVVDLDTRTVTGSITVEGIPVAVAINGNGTRAFVAGNMNTGGVSKTGRMSVIDTASNSVIAAVNTGYSPYEIAVGRNWVMVSNSGQGANDGSVSQISASNYGIASDFAVGGIPAGVTIFERPLPEPAVADAEVTGIEVTQGIQDLSNSVRLLLGRRTYVRVYVRSKSGAALPPLTAFIYGNTPTSGYGSLAPSNAGGSISIPVPAKRHRLADSFYFELPHHWYTAANTLRINVELQVPGHAAPFCNPDGPRKEVGFQPGTQLGYQMVRMGYRYANSYLEATEADQFQAESMLYRIFPLSDYLHHAPIIRTHWELAAHVDRSHEDCLKMPSADIGACAAEFVNWVLGIEHMFGNYKDASGGYALIPQITTTERPDAAKLYTRGACCVFDFASGATTSPMTAPHEIAHRFGRHHPDEMSDICGHKGGDPGYPYPLTAIHPLSPYDPATGLAGFDIGDAGLGATPGAVPPDDVYDYMSYCGSKRWTSDYTYDAIYAALRAANPYFNKISPRPSSVRTRAVTPQPGDWLGVAGTLDPSGTGSVPMLIRRASAVTLLPALVPGPYSIRLLGAGGVQLADYPFTPQAVSESRQQSLSFVQAVPFVNGTREIQIVELAGNRVLGTRAVSAGLPSVGTVTLQGPVDPATGQVSLSWSASDPDNDALSYEVQVSRDGGLSYEPLVSGIPQDHAVVNTSFTGGGTAILRVIASDGVNSGHADSASFEIPAKPPAVYITNPRDGALLNEGQVLVLDGRATDAQDDVIPDSGLVWKLAGRIVGAGRKLDLADLEVGAKQLSLTATNSRGLSATANISVVVNAIVANPGPTLSVGPDSINWQVKAGDTQPKSRTVDVGNVGVGTLPFTAELGDAGSWLTLSQTSGVAPAMLTLTADPAGLANGTLKRATLKVSGLAGQDVNIPVTLAVGDTFSEPAGASPPPPIPAPTADAGADQTTTEGNDVTLSGAASTVASGHAASYLWTQKQGTAVTISGAATLTAKFRAPKPSGTREVLTFELAVSDDTGQRAVDEVNITVDALPVQTPPSPAPPPANPPPKKGGGALEWWTLVLLAMSFSRRWRCR